MTGLPQRPANTRVCLVRHGQTDWNVEKRIQGQTEVPLNATGRVQALALANSLRAERPPAGFAALYCSDLGRARETAEILGGGLELAVRAQPALREPHRIAPLPFAEREDSTARRYVSGHLGEEGIGLGAVEKLGAGIALVELGHDNGGPAGMRSHSL